MIFLITGGSSGLGYRLVDFLSKNKDNFIYTTYRNNFPSKFKKLNNVSLIKADFKKPSAIEKLFEVVENLDFLINNYHSGYSFKHTSKFTSKEVLKSFSINISPLIDINNHFIKIMKKNKSGCIISILSDLTDMSPSLGFGIYTAEKFYLKTLSDHWSKELTSYNISAVNISPRMLNTEFNSSIDSRYLGIIKKQGGFSNIKDVIKKIEEVIADPRRYNGRNIKI